MASHYSLTPTHILLLLTIFISLHLSPVSSFEFVVAGTSHGWTVPPPNNSQIYNKWAADNRFQIGDTLRFRYRKDSVMEVNESDYKKCNSSHPNYFSNTGNSVFRLDHSGPFYFISGVSRHCEMGQRMIVKVMAPEDSDGGEGGGSSSGGGAVLAVSKLVFFQFVLSYVAVSVF